MLVKLIILLPYVMAATRVIFNSKVDIIGSNFGAVGDSSNKGNVGKVDNIIGKISNLVPYRR